MPPLHVNKESENMKANVLKAFIDRDTGEGYNVDDIYSTDDAERMNELAANGFVKKTAQRKKPPAVTDEAGKEAAQAADKPKG